jgi:molybdopterin synthase catalytic subunit
LPTRLNARHDSVAGAVPSLDDLGRLRQEMAGGTLSAYTGRVPVPRFAVTTSPLSIELLTGELERLARHRDEGCGALVSFLGVVRATHKGRGVRHLEYEAFEPLALKVFTQIDEEVRHEWPGVLLALHHRVGRLAIGEASVAIAAAAAHRADAFQACRYAIERVKQVAPVWKHEFFEDGDAWVEGALVDPDDARARAEALARSCA